LGDCENSMDSRITADVVEAYSQCKRKAFFLLRGEPEGPQHDYVKAVADRASATRRAYLAERSDNVSIPDPRGGCDGLLPSEHSDSPLARVPILAIGTRNIAREQGVRLAFAGHLLTEGQRERPKHGIAIPFQGQPQRVQLSRFYTAIQPIVSNLEEWIPRLSDDPPPLMLNKHCGTCPFRDTCLKEAKEHDNLSLLERMTPKLIQRYRKRGILTATQLSYAYRPRRWRKRLPTATCAFNVELQALAIRTGKIYLHEPPALVRNPVELFFDIEGLPDEDFDYLIGLHVREDDRLTEHSFWAESKSEERDIFARCLDIAAKYPEAPILHYGGYEPRAIARITDEYDIDCEWFNRRLVNVNTTIFGKVYFPVRSNRLKDVACHVGASWTVPEVSGLHSIAWRYKWEDTGDPKYKDLLLAYNREDCQALRLLASELNDIAITAKSRTDIAFANKPKQNASPAGEGIHHVFEAILASAHHDYRASRITLHPPALEPDQDAPEKKVVRKRRATVPRRLPRCKGTVIRVRRKETCPRHRKRSLTPSDKLAELRLIDLVLSRSGFRKTLVTYVGRRAYCDLCDFAYLPPTIRRMQGRVFGDRFQAWAVYQHVALRVPYRAIMQQFEDIYSETVTPTTMLNFMSQLSEKHADTENLLLKSILASPFIHVDETKLNIKGANQYVWVLTDGQHVIFRLTETRETAQLQALIRGYQGVLVTDFYGGYDAMSCRQQKCWVHLVRDVNDDLWKNPFRADYELFVGHVRDLVLPIFTDVQKYGLRIRHLRKHKKMVDRFYKETIEARDPDDELIGKYRKRFLRYRSSLFRFLEEDDVPWNNNMAERAIRHLAVQRKISGSFSTAGAGDHLRLLGIAQSCRFQSKSFLHFLLSGGTDVDAFKSRRRGR